MKLEELQDNLQDKLIEYCQLKNNWSLADDLCEIVIIEISAFHKANYKSQRTKTSAKLVTAVARKSQLHRPTYRDQ